MRKRDERLRSFAETEKLSQKCVKVRYSQHMLVLCDQLEGQGITSSRRECMHPRGEL